MYPHDALWYITLSLMVVTDLMLWLIAMRINKTVRPLILFGAIFLLLTLLGGLLFQFL